MYFLMCSFINFRFSVEWFEKTSIVASNDINEETIHSLNQQVYSLKLINK